jgi:hypothetical protein
MLLAIQPPDRALHGQRLCEAESAGAWPAHTSDTTLQGVTDQTLLAKSVTHLGIAHAMCRPNRHSSRAAVGHARHGGEGQAGRQAFLQHVA